MTRKERNAQLARKARREAIAKETRDRLYSDTVRAVFAEGQDKDFHRVRVRAETNSDYIRRLEETNQDNYLSAMADRHTARKGYQLRENPFPIN